MSGSSVRAGLDVRILGGWIERDSRVCDLGCGRGELLEHLIHERGIRAVGVDIDPEKIAACIRRGVTAYQGDIGDFLGAIPEGAFDHIICSRTLEELHDPAAVLRGALRVARRVTVGFVNHAYWKNRLRFLARGRGPRGTSGMDGWTESPPSNPLSVADFEAFCARNGIAIARRALISGDRQIPRRLLPNLLAGCAVYELRR